MNHNGTDMWTTGSGQPLDASGHGVDDFHDFLNFGDIPLNLPSPYDAQTTHSSGHTPMDTDFGLGVDFGAPEQGSNGLQSASNGPHAGDDFMSIQFDEMEKRMQEDQQREYLAQQNNLQRNGVPPTPTSMEMHGSLSQTALHMQSHMIDRFSQYREEPMVFTPLVSPAVTPLDVDFTQPPEFAVPFSPLTSPALRAHPYRTSMGDTHSLSHHHLPKPMDPSQSPIIKKLHGRRKSVTGSRNPSRVVKQSPSIRPQRKKHTLPNISMPQSATLPSQNSQATTPGSISGSLTNTPIQYPMSREESSNESVSPEPLPEILMAPPPPPQPRSEGDEAPTRRPRNSPVTPATLMKLQKTNISSDDIPPISMDTTEYLHRRVDIDPSSATSITQNSNDMTTPTMNPSTRTPTLRPHPTPRLKRPHNHHSSPPLLPKVSPSIKPLLPQGMSPDASAFLLASKSNYQNIVEGNHSSLGLQYPEHLSTNLTSKRTSHKIAEQGRRNRINMALAEMASLLPPSSAKGGDSDGGGGSGGSGNKQKETTSKAHTVERAIEYIRQLQGELESVRERLRVVEGGALVGSPGGKEVDGVGAGRSPSAGSAVNGHDGGDVDMEGNNGGAN